jgi:hypothetical protein
VLLLDISTNLGPEASPAHIETLVKGLRVVSDVAYDAESARVRRAATERMKFPTDAELANALERLPSNDDTDPGPQERARRQLAARRLAYDEIGPPAPYEFWPEYWYRRRKSTGSSPERFDLLSEAGYDRLTATPYPPGGGAIGLDVIDPVLYDALVADDLIRNLPERVGIRELHYQNPFWASLLGKGRAEKTISTTAEVIEVIRDYGPTRKIAKAEAAVAEASVGPRLAEQHIDVEIKQERLAQARLQTERLWLENQRLRQSLGADEHRRILIERAVQGGQLDYADAIRALSTNDVQALGQLSQRTLELNQRSEEDPPTSM